MTTITEEISFSMNAGRLSLRAMVYTSRNTSAPSTTVEIRLMTVATRTPSRARPGCRAPQFWPTNVVEDMLMLCTGIRAKASILP